MGCCQEIVPQLSLGTLPRSKASWEGDAAALRIALVDYEEGVYSAGEGMTRSMGWTVGYYSEGRQAVPCIPFTHPDNVLMDTLMSGLFGIDCSRKLKCDSSNNKSLTVCKKEDYNDG